MTGVYWSVWLDPNNIQTEVQQNIIDAQHAIKIYHDCQRHGGVKYEVCEVVVVTRPPVSHLLVKLLSKYHAKPLQMM